MKGLAISNSDLIRTVHNSFARSDPFVNEIVDPNAGKDQDVYHFIAYTPIHGALYELDGLSPGPINLGACDDENWVNLANEAIQRRMEGYGAAELHFSLMAITKDKLELYEEQIEETDGLLLSLSEDATSERNQLNHQRAEIEHKLHLEKEKRSRWHVSSKSLFFFLENDSSFLWMTNSPSFSFFFLRGKMNCESIISFHLFIAFSEVSLIEIN